MVQAVGGQEVWTHAHWLIIVLSLCLRYGFHGTSHDFVVQAVGRMVEGPAAGTCVVSCHLGAGCSVAGMEGWFLALIFGF